MEQAVAEVEVIELTAAAAPFDDVDVQQWARHVFQEVRVQRVSRAAGKPHPSAAGAGGARTFYWWMLASALLALALA